MQKPHKALKFSYQLVITCIYIHIYIYMYVYIYIYMYIYTNNALVMLKRLQQIQLKLLQKTNSKTSLSN